MNKNIANRSINEIKRDIAALNYIPSKEDLTVLECAKKLFITSFSSRGQGSSPEHFERIAMAVRYFPQFKDFPRYNEYAKAVGKIKRDFKIKGSELGVSFSLRSMLNEDATFTKDDLFIYTEQNNELFNLLREGVYVLGGRREVVNFLTDQYGILRKKFCDALTEINVVDALNKQGMKYTPTKQDLKIIKLAQKAYEAREVVQDFYAPVTPEAIKAELAFKHISDFKNYKEYAWRASDFENKLGEEISLIGVLFGGVESLIFQKLQQDINTLSPLINNMRNVVWELSEKSARKFINNNAGYVQNSLSKK